MTNERQDIINLDEVMEKEIQERIKKLKEEAERQEENDIRDYDAQVQAGLIDPEKLKKYAEIMDRGIESERKEPPPRNAEAQEAALREAQEVMLNDETFAWFSPSTPCQPNAVIDGETWSNTWESNNPMFSGGTDAFDKYNLAQKQLNFKLVAWEGYVFSPLLAQAWGGGYQRFKIPGKVIPYGKIEVTPYINIHGMARVAGWLSSNFYPGCGASAKIEVETRMGQAVQGYPYPWIKTISQWTTPYTLWKEQSPPVKGMSGWQNINITKFVDQAKVVGDVDAGLDVYIDVLVSLYCDTRGWGISSFYFEDNYDFIKIEKVCMKTLQKYMYMIKTPDWWWRGWDIPHIPDWILKDLKEKE
ncbi:MAG: hypothetical protein R6T90_10220 [Dissulfuribacterales bacterium]